MLMSFKRSQASVVLRVMILDSGFQDGRGLVGLTPGSTGLRIAATADIERGPASGSGAGFGVVYTAAATTIQAIATPGTYAAPTAGSCRFGSVDATNHPGLYEVQLDNARYAVAAAKALVVQVGGAVGCVETPVVVPLVDLDPYSAYVNLGPGSLEAVPMTPPAGQASNFREAMVMVWRYFFKKKDKTAAPGTIKTYTDAGAQITQQPYTDDGAGNQVVNSAG
jgi:hypothetical protein